MADPGSPRFPIFSIPDTTLGRCEIWRPVIEKGRRTLDWVARPVRLDFPEKKEERIFLTKSVTIRNNFEPTPLRNIRSFGQGEKISQTQHIPTGIDRTLKGVIPFTSLKVPDGSTSPFLWKYGKESKAGIGLLGKIPST